MALSQNQDPVGNVFIIDYPTDISDFSLFDSVPFRLIDVSSPVVFLFAFKVVSWC